MARSEPAVREAQLSERSQREGSQSCSGHHDNQHSRRVVSLTAQKGPPLLSGGTEPSTHPSTAARQTCPPASSLRQELLRGTTPHSSDCPSTLLRLWHCRCSAHTCWMRTQVRGLQKIMLRSVSWSTCFKIHHQCHLLQGARASII